MEGFHPISLPVPFQFYDLMSLNVTSLSISILLNLLLSL